MKKHHHHKKGRRNNGGGAAPASHHRPRSYAPRLPRRGPPPDWKTIVAALAGGAGSAALGGLVVNQKILSPEAVGLGLMLGGGATAFYSDSTSRVVGFSVAAAGAGQLALALMTRQAIKSAANHNMAPPAAPLPAPPPAAPPPPVEPPRRSAFDGGVVVDLFRDTASHLDMLDDDWRFGMHDMPRDAEPFVIDLDDVA